MKKISIKEIAVFGIISAIMFVSKILMQGLPNIHLVGVIIVAITLKYRFKALYPIYGYVLLEGVFGGFAIWWIPYLYIWAVLWGAVMLVSPVVSKFKPAVKYLLLSIVCALHGFLFGIMYTPAQALFYGMNFKAAIAWIISGIPFDIYHGCGNLFLGLLLIYPIKKGLDIASKPS